MDAYFPTREILARMYWDCIHAMREVDIYINNIDMVDIDFIRNGIHQNACDWLFNLAEEWHRQGAR